MERINRAGRRAVVSLLTAGTLVAAVACASPGQSGADVTTAGSGSARPLERPAVKSPATDVRLGSFRTASSSTVEAAAKRCSTGGLKARVGAVSAGAGQRYAPLVLTNTSTKSCWVYGFVGLIMFDGRGDALRTRVRRESVRPQRITLRPGAGAHARMHWTVTVTGHESTCPTSARLMVIAPDEVAHLEIPFTSVICDDGRLDITPMAAGTHL
ncbi:DUF4232 domain-containing protein [Streptosporangium sp. 'caverna']|uniref:DUF4232 domain-containing protein n=1 Tax=Streptosporangium sp. 'caverna' TaxID=2202249 RepID=UPI000D7DC05E|nr:DUF4232 domain-containing protein [Streptosporangium sp. 'caverna']AWS44012.1 hypothetical protein DKM19_24330 [Streptosporangium sp. 'caverna']